ncbi:50S ribosomal protein L24 [Candidatus Foliamicus sp.]
MQRLKSGDEVIVIAGAHRGERGVVRKLVGRERVLVENVNLVRKHRKPNPQQNQPGGIVEEERPLHVSNVALYNPRNEKAGRIGVKALVEGRRVRYFKSDGEVIDST